MAEQVVYLEDIQTKAEASPEDEPPKASPDLGTQPKVTNPTNATTVKRQRTLMDMLGSTRESAQNAKKARVSTPSGPSVPDTKVALPTKTLGLQRLNAIPFSLSAYQESFSDEEKRLLRLECEAMGLTWYATRSCTACTAFILTTCSQAQTPQGRGKRLPTPVSSPS
jgi:uracil-DNA glycosylase